jgi:hypothetical protein
LPFSHRYFKQQDFKPADFPVDPAALRSGGPPASFVLLSWLPIRIYQTQFFTQLAEIGRDSAQFSGFASWSRLSSS